MNAKDRHVALIRMAAVAFERAADAARNALPNPAAYGDTDGWREDEASVKQDIDELRDLARQWNDWADRFEDPSHERGAL